MNDCISRQGAIDAIFGRSHDIIKARLKNLPSAQPERWISCSKRLPDTNGDYLVTGRQGAVNKRRFEDGRWYGNWAVIAWRELPEPYKGE